MHTKRETKYSGVLFDLDGTLIDHFKVIYRCYQFALKELNLPEVSFEKVKASVGGSIVITFGKLIAQKNVPKAVSLFREEYDRIWREDIIILPHARWFINELKDSGYRLGVFTNKEGENARKVLNECGLASSFDFITGTLDTPYRKPEIEFSKYALGQFGLKAAEVCMIGDSPYDVDAAKVVGMDAFVVATGSHTSEQLRSETQADGVYENFKSLAQGVFKLDSELEHV